MTNLALTKEINEFNALLQTVASYGTLWAPTQDRLKLANLQSKANEMKTMHLALSNSFYQVGRATQNRKTAQQTALVQARKIRYALNLYLGENHPQRILLDQLFKQINPRHKAPKRAGQPESDSNQTANNGIVRKSTSQTSFTDRLDQFARLTTLLKSNPDYEPNESGLSTEAWETTVANLHTLNQRLQTAQAQLEHQRHHRDELNEQLKTLEREIKQYQKVL